MIDLSIIKLDNIQAFRIATSVSDDIWNIVCKCNLLAKKTVGEQVVRSADSIAANIAEAEGQHFKKDKMKFYYYSRGSIYETAFWVERAFKRKLISQEKYDDIMSELRKLPIQINFLIKNASLKLKS